jgi:hypothetical protein
MERRLRIPQRSLLGHQSPCLDLSPLEADPGATKSIRAEAEFSECPFGTKSVSEGGLEPPCPVKGTSTSS